MATQKQILANRANAARSTGPVTPDGKKISSQNSTRHGMLAQTVVLEGESQSRFEDLLIAFEAQFQPRTPAEAAIVETMAIARWKQMRIWGIEKAGFQLEMSRESSADGANATRGYLTFKKLADNSRVLDLQHRYETGYERQFCRAYSFLLKLRAKPEAPADDPGPQGLSPLQFSSATATWESSPEDDKENEAGNQVASPIPMVLETPQSEQLAHPKPICRSNPILACSHRGPFTATLSRITRDIANTRPKWQLH